MVTAHARSAPRWNGSVSVETSCGRSFAPVFSTVSMTDPGRMTVLTCTVPCSGRLWTIALCRRFVVICSKRVWEPTVGVMSPEVSMVTPRFSARGRSVSVASSAMVRDKSTVFSGERPAGRCG